MKKSYLLIILIVAALVIIIGLKASKPNPSISGKPLSEWVENLNDKDSETILMALDKIYLVDKEECARAKEKLRDLSLNMHASKRIRGRAAILLHLKFDESSPESIQDIISILRYDKAPWEMEAVGALSFMREQSDTIIAYLVEIVCDPYFDYSSESLGRRAALELALRAFGEPALKALESAPRSLKNVSERDDEKAQEFRKMMIKSLKEELGVEN